MRPEFKITAVYLAIGILWIYFSDSLISTLFDNQWLSNITYFQTIKGFFYVVVTSIILFFMIRSYYVKTKERISLLQEKNNAEAQIEKNNTFFKALITNSHDGIIVYGQDRLIQFSSPSACRLLGYEDNFLEGKSVIDFTLPEDSTVGNDSVEGLLNGENESAKFRLRMRKKNGGVIWVEVLVTLFKVNKDDERMSFVANFRDVSEEVHSGEKLEAYNRLLLKESIYRQTILDQSLDIICTLNDRGKFVDINRAVEHITGYSQQELLGKFCIDYLHEEDRDKTKSLLQSTSRDQPVYDFRNRFLTKNGDIKVIDWSGRWVESECLIYIVGRDVSMQVAKDSFEKLKTSVLNDLNNAETQTAYQSILKNLVEHLNIEAAELWLPNMEKTKVYQKCYYSNTAFENCFDQFRPMMFEENEDVVGRVLAENKVIYIRDLNKEDSFQRQNPLMDCGISSLIAIPVHFADELVGIVIYYSKEILSTNSYSSSIDLIHSIWSGDIKRRVSKEMFESILSISRDIFCILDQCGRPLWFNPAFGRTLGYSLDDLLQKSIVDFSHEEDKEKTVEFLQNLFSGQSINHFVNRIITNNKKELWLSWSGVLLSKEGVSVVSARDITELKNSEVMLSHMNTNLQNRATELELSNRVLEEFVNIVSHDLQEPLRMVSSFLVLLKKNYEENLDEKAIKYIHFATDGAERMSKLIQDLLSYSRVGATESSRELVDMNEVVDNALVLLRKEITDKNAVIHFDKLPSVVGVRSLLNQLIQNLISNALKYSTVEVPTVTIGTLQDDSDKSVFYVKDNGIGISQNDYERIFLIFQRLHKRDEFSGSGVGLAICKKIVDIHQGEIWLDSSVGEGSSFYFSIANLELQETENKQFMESDNE